jgi:hypothetical protein
MKWSREIWTVAVGAVAFGVAVGLCLMAMPGAKASDAPAWVQAVGSVAAIIAAIVIDQGARRQAADALQEADEKRENECRAAMQNALFVVEELRDNIPDADRATDVRPPQINSFYLREIRRADALLKHYIGRGEVGPRTISVMMWVRDTFKELRAATDIYENNRQRPSMAGADPYAAYDDFVPLVALVADTIASSLKDHREGKW